jgi:hypothetical protein
MDPYLEDSKNWAGFHQFLATNIAAQLNMMIGPKYYADIEVRTIIQGVDISARQSMYPDAGILHVKRPSPGPTTMTLTLPTATIPNAPLERKAFLATQGKLRAVRIYVTETTELVTTIEILSPFNKQKGDGVETYRLKRQRILESAVHLVELDLLRGGERPGDEVRYPPIDSDYICLVNRANETGERKSGIWPIALNEPLPLLPIPLLPPDPDIPLDMMSIFKTVYQQGGYDWRIDYSLPVPPPELRPGIADWVQTLLISHRV